MSKIIKTYADTPWANDGETLSDAYGNDLFVADDEQDRGTLALFYAAPDLAEALIDILEDLESREYPYQHSLRIKSIRAVLTKAGIIE